MTTTSVIERLIHTKPQERSKPSSRIDGTSDPLEGRKRTVVTLHHDSAGQYSPDFGKVTGVADYTNGHLDGGKLTSYYQSSSFNSDSPWVGGDEVVINENGEEIHRPRQLPPTIGGIVASLKPGELLERLPLGSRIPTAEEIEAAKAEAAQQTEEHAAPKSSSQASRRLRHIPKGR